MGSGVSGLRDAIVFLTRVPMMRRGQAPDDPGRAGPWFPLVGALVGLVVAGSYGLIYPWLPSLLGAIVAVAIGVMLTGAFHEDGLADTFDALGTGATGEEALRIMRDSRLGTYGTAALVFSVSWRVVAVASLNPAGALAGLVSAHTLGRLGAVTLMAVTPSARADGLGRAGVSGVTVSGAWFAIVTGIGIAVAAIGWWAAPVVVAIAIAVVLTRGAAMGRIGGVTGDVLGACEQIGEMLVLALVAGAAWRGWEPWWMA